MQNFSNPTADDVSANEAQEVLKAWTNRQQAQGVDPSVNSVQALASGLGVSEDEVRKMLEDIRVQQRSQQIAAGILQQEQKHRKKMDTTAAIFAAVAIVVVGLAFIIFFAVRKGVQTLPPPPAQQTVSSDIPPIAPLAPLASAQGAPLTIHSKDGTTTIIDQYGIHIQKPDGKEIDITNPTARSQLAAKVAELKAEEAAKLAKKQGGKLTPEQLKQLEDVSNASDDIDKALKSISDGDSLPQAPPATPAPSGR